MNQLILNRRRRNNYNQKVLSYDPIGYWMWAESSGTTAIDQIDSPNQDGLYSGGITLGQSGIGDGLTSGLVNQGVLNVDTNTLDAKAKGSKGSFTGWFYPTNWNDGGTHYFFRFYVDADNFIYVRKNTVNDQLTYLYEAATVSDNVVATTSRSNNVWFHFAATWSDSNNANELKLFINGSQIGTTTTGLGAYADGALAIAAIADDHPTPGTSAWVGRVAHTALFDYVLTPSEIADLANL